MELFDEFKQLVSEFKKENIEFALCGGLAMAVYAFPRATLDIDILKDVWDTKRVLTWDEGELPIVSIKGLIKLKSMRSSGQDLDDIRNLESIEDED